MEKFSRIIQNAYQRVTSLYGNYEMDVAPEKVILGNGERLVDVCDRVLGRPPERVYGLGKSGLGGKSFKIRLQGQFLKCYEVYSEYRAQMVCKATAVLQDNQIPIPRIIERDGHVIFAEWIAGELQAKYNSKKIFDRLLDYQLALHNAQLDDDCRRYEKMLYLEHALDMITENTPPEIGPEQCQAVCARLRDMVPPGLINRVVHHDYKKGNLITRPEGSTYIIDNEALGIGLGSEIDILYSARMLFRRSPEYRDKYIREYAKRIGSESILDNGPFWDICFLVRHIGDQFFNNNPEEGLAAWNRLLTQLG